MHTDIETDRILRANSKLCEMLGYAREELLSLTTDQILHPDNVGADRLKYRDKLLKGELESYFSERMYLRKDGSVITADRTVSLVRDAAGKPEYFIRIMEDISERKRAERQREMEHAVTRALAQAASVAEAMPRVLQTICEGLDWVCGAHWQWDEKTESLRIAEAWHGGGEEVEDFIAEGRASTNEAPAWSGAAPGLQTGGLVRSVWYSGNPVWIPDIAQHADFRRGPPAARAGLHSAFGFPILAEAQPLGVMEFFSRAIKQPDEALLQIVRAIGSQIGQFIQRKQAEAALRDSEEQLRQLAHYDNLTGLPNRVLFLDRLQQALSQARRNHWTMAVMFLDLDRFKNVNDTLGHGAGDVLLMQVSKRLAGCVRSGDTVGRLSGDEFAVALSNLSHPDDAGLVAQKMMAALSRPFDLDGKEVFASASIGITLFPTDSTDQESLIRNADTAMYRAKEMGRNRVQFYTPEMNARAMEKLNLENSLRHALQRGEFLLYYQPKASLANGEVTGVEALLRWQRPELGMTSPVDFIPMLEETGLIIPVGEWVIRTACAQIRAWQSAGIRPIPVAVNLSARQFQASDLGATIARILEEEGIEHHLLELEITESSLVDNTEEAARTLEFLNSLGVRVSIDDFGTGYSSLSYLKRFPLDALKIDSSFVRDITTDPDDAAITKAIITMAHSLELAVIAEGVETEQQLNFLSANGCDQIQGYFFSRALPAADCTEFLACGRQLELPVPAEPGMLLTADIRRGLLAVLEARTPAGGLRRGG
jgi:diguanylate cyclase (GGDEF)-like protein/PAS domain S-box-containing protein